MILLSADDCEIQFLTTGQAEWFVGTGNISIAKAQSPGFVFRHNGKQISRETVNQMLQDWYAAERKRKRTKQPETPSREDDI